MYKIIINTSINYWLKSIKKLKVSFEKCLKSMHFLLCCGKEFFKKILSCLVVEGM